MWWTNTVVNRSHTYAGPNEMNIFTLVYVHTVHRPCRQSQYIGTRVTAYRTFKEPGFVATFFWDLEKCVSRDTSAKLDHRRLTLRSQLEHCAMLASSGDGRFADSLNHVTPSIDAVWLSLILAIIYGLINWITLTIYMQRRISQNFGARVV